jgi:tetratricopeptide (TPR) repeat protein
MFDSAETHAKAAAILEPTNVLTVDRLGLIYSNMNRFPEALQSYKKVMQMDAKFVAEYKHIGFCCLRMHDYDSAIAYFRKALTASPEYTRLLYSDMATSFRETGKMDSAKKYEKLARQ